MGCSKTTSRGRRTCFVVHRFECGPEILMRTQNRLLSMTGEADVHREGADANLGGSSGCPKIDDALDGPHRKVGQLRAAVGVELESVGRPVDGLQMCRLVSAGGGGGLQTSFPTKPQFGQLEQH